MRPLSLPDTLVSSQQAPNVHTRQQGSSGTTVVSHREDVGGLSMVSPPASREFAWRWAGMWRFEGIDIFCGAAFPWRRAISSVQDGDCLPVAVSGADTRPKTVMRPRR